MATKSITHLHEGHKAPLFRTVDQDGKPFDARDMEGKRWVLFFYPRDMTPTCTVEVCNLRDHHAELRDAGYEVIGISLGDEKGKKKNKQSINLREILGLTD